MCIIAYKPVGVSFPSKKQFRTMFENNPDGCGYMFADNGKVTIRKGLMEYDEFKRAFKADLFGRIDIPVVFHFRIATHGGINRAMTQPFPLSSKTKKLKALNTCADVGIAHNGIIPLTYNARDISDTALFIKNYMPRLSEHGFDSIALDLIESAIDSRMAILESCGKCHILGANWQICNGIYYSNDSYKERKWKVKSNSKYLPYSYDSFDYSLCDGNCDYCTNKLICFGTDSDIYKPTDREMEL